MRDKRSSSKSSKGRKVFRRRTSFHKAEHSISAILQGDHLAPRHKRGAFCGVPGWLDSLGAKVPYPTDTRDQSMLTSHRLDFRTCLMVRRDHCTAGCGPLSGWCGRG